jgi:hypothetical protein
MALHCVGNYEQNLYHDSYYFSVFWDDEDKTLVRKEVGSTAYGGGHHSTALTTDEAVWAEVNGYWDKRLAEAKAAYRKQKADRIRAARSILKENGVHTAFCRNLTLEDLEDVAALFSKRVRNKFKLKMREQVLAWTPSNGYSTPLSGKQMAFVRRPLRDQYGHPTKRAQDIEKPALDYTRVRREFRGIGYK